MNCPFSLTTCQELGLVTTNHDKFISKVEEEPGLLGTATLQTDPEVRPQVFPCRKKTFCFGKESERRDRIPYKKRNPDTSFEPTNWVSQMAIVEKENGSLRICIEPCLLNKALKRESIISFLPWTMSYLNLKMRKYSQS